MDSTTPVTLLQGRAWAKQAGRQQAVEVLRGAAREWDHKVHFTFWRGGVTATLGGTVSRPGSGVVIEAPLVEYVSGLKTYSQEVFPKGEGLVIAHGISTTLGSHDAECEAITWAFGDADEVGDWDPLRVAFAQAGLAYVMGRSASSTVDKPRWHLEVPLAEPLAVVGDLADFKHRYCAEYGFILGILSEVGGLACISGGKPGFDPATSRLLQPMYPGCRRTMDSTPPETVVMDGKALDWSALIKSTGFTVPPAPPTSTKKPSGSKVDMDPTSSGEIPGLARAMEIDGLYLGMKNGKALVRCVQEDRHTTGTAGDTSTVILPGGALGVFNCKHSHCIGLSQQDVIAMLSEEAQAFIADLLAVAGLERLKRQLDTQADLFSQECSLDEIEQVVGKRLDGFEGGVLVVVIPTGAGKTRAARKVLVVRRAGVLAVPSHALGGECADALEADGVAVQRRRGVVRAASDLGACKHMSLALQVQQAGGSVPVLCCSRCSERSSCPARRPEGPDGKVIVLPHALLPALKDGTEAASDMPSRELVVIDETPQLWAEVVIKEPFLAKALATLGTSIGELVEARFRAGHLVLAKLLLEMKGGAIPMDTAANAVIASGEDTNRLAEVEKTTMSLMWGAEGRPASQRLVALAQFLSIWKPEEVLARGRPALVTATKEQVEDTLAVLKVLRPLHTAARALAGSNRVPLRWRSGGLVVQVPTPEADYIAEKGGVILDATPDLLELKHLCSAGFELVKVVVADGAKVERTVRYCSEASRRRLLPKGDPEWKKVVPLVREALDRAKEAGVHKLLLVTYKPLVEHLKKADSPCAALFDEWKRGGRDLDFAHYGAVRGLNRWETFDGCVSLGDPWQPVEALGDRATVLGVHPDLYRREAAARELAQVHGRLRAPSRKTPAWLLHIGRLAPSDWSTLNTKVETVRRGPKVKTSSLTPAELKELVERVGGVIKAAAIADCDRRTLGRYLRGERAVPEDVARLLSASGTALVR